MIPSRYKFHSASRMIHAGYRHISFRTPSETRLSCRIARSARRVNGEAARINFLHNALGQRVFKGEPQAEQTLPSEAQLGQDFITWLKRQFGWLFAQAQANTSIGTAYTFADGPIPQWAILGEYDNGSAKGAGRSEYIWLPTQDGAIPVGMFRNGKFFAIHSDHLGTPRLMTTEANQPVWQWPYSAFGDNKPTGILRATPNPKAAITNIPVLLKATAATELNLRFPGQYDDAETGTVYNYQRQYLASQGRYTQPDPIGLEGGLNRFGYVEGNPLSYSDPQGLDNPKMGPYGPGPNNYGKDASSHWQRTAALADFIRNYNNMREANTKKSDHYFHCKANCEATRRGRFGEALACSLSDARELWDQYGYKWDSPRNSRADQAANALGRSGALSSTQSCSAVCGMFRPKGLPDIY